jgi:DNA repair exonuclease SbcCD ATPase subunit
MNLKEIRTSIIETKGRRAEAKQTLSSTQFAVDTLTKEIKRSEKAQAIIQKVAKDTQSQLEYHISDIVTLALDTVFDEKYKFKIEFVIKRNKTECELVFEKDGEVMDPMEDDAGGAVDVASFALRIALWTLQAPRSRNTIILDEPFKFLSKDLRPRASELLKELSTRLKLQFIIVTHLDELTECADRIFKIEIKKGISHVKNME